MGRRQGGCLGKGGEQAGALGALGDTWVSNSIKTKTKATQLHTYEE